MPKRARKSVKLQKGCCKGFVAHNLEGLLSLAGSAIVFRRTFARNAQGLPMSGSEVLRKQKDLPDVIRVVRELAVDNLDCAMELV